MFVVIKAKIELNPINYFVFSYSTTHYQYFIYPMHCIHPKADSSRTAVCEVEAVVTRYESDVM